MTVTEIMASLEAHGDENIKKILMRHGVREPFFGVKVEHLKTIQKKVKKDYQLAKDLYATGNADAMYLAGLIADDEKMTEAELRTWAEQAAGTNITEYTVPWVAAGSHHGYTLAQEWIDSSEEHIAATGWATLSNLVALKPDNALDIPALKLLLDRIAKTITTSANRVRYTMNGYIIAVGAYVTPLHSHAIATANKIGTIMVEMGDTACKVPDAVVYIKKIEDRGGLGKKKKMVKC